MEGRPCESCNIPIPLSQPCVITFNHENHTIDSVKHFSCATDDPEYRAIFEGMDGK